MNKRHQIYQRKKSENFQNQTQIKRASNDTAIIREFNEYFKFNYFI